MTRTDKWIRAGRGPAVTGGKGWAYVGFGLGVAVSVAGNVAHTWHPSAPVLRAAGVTADQWRPEIGAQLVAAFFPLALLVTVEVLARVQWPNTLGWSATRYGGAALVAGVAAVVSYLHLRGLLLAYGEDPLTALIGPLSVDGLMVVSGFALIAVGRTVSVVEAEPVAVEEGAHNLRTPVGVDPVAGVTDDTRPEPDPLVPTARERFAEGLARGDLPSVKQVRKELRVGWPRAKQILAALTTS